MKISIISPVYREEPMFSYTTKNQLEILSRISVYLLWV